MSCKVISMIVYDILLSDVM